MTCAGRTIRCGVVVRRVNDSNSARLRGQVVMRLLLQIRTIILGGHFHEKASFVKADVAAAYGWLLMLQVS